TAQANFLDVSTVLATLPTATTRRIVTWCVEMFGPADHSLTPSCSSSAEIPVSNGFAIHERAVEFGSPAVFGMISEPIGPARGPVAVLLNVASEHHVGPSRMWVDLAREWASLGLRAVRVDLSGLGDSPSAPGQRPGLAFPYNALFNMRQIANTVSPDDPTGLVWMGMCSGGYHALEAAAAFGAAGAFVVNPKFTIVPPEGRLATQESWRRMCCVIPAWARNPSKSDKIPLRSPRHIRGLVYRCLYKLGLRSTPAGGLRELNRRSKLTTIVSAPDDAKPLLRFRWARMAGRYSNVQLQVIANLDHSLLHTPQRKEVAAMATVWMITRSSAES
ncbi:MAG: alpha/beta hydrolase, partial [Actinomycetota bacterium]|nr:alpha/beta hydrolase [Actinomycetota bacterium]